MENLITKPVNPQNLLPLLIAQKNCLLIESNNSVKLNRIEYSYLQSKLNRLENKIKTLSVKLINQDKALFNPQIIA